MKETKVGDRKYRSRAKLTPNALFMSIKQSIISRSRLITDDLWDVYIL